MDALIAEMRAERLALVQSLRAFHIRMGPLADDDVRATLASYLAAQPAR